VKNFSLGEVVAENGESLCLYVGEVNGEQMGQVVNENQQWDPMPLVSILARYGWEATSPATKGGKLDRWLNDA